MVWESRRLSGAGTACGSEGKIFRTSEVLACFQPERSAASCDPTWNQAELFAPGSMLGAKLGRPELGERRASAPVHSGLRGPRPADGARKLRPREPAPRWGTPAWPWRRSVDGTTSRIAHENGPSS